MKKLLFILLVMWAGGAAGLWYWNEGRPRRVSYRTVTVARGDLLATINATGTLEPEEVVDVGVQVAGEVLSFGDDPAAPGKAITYGSLVDQGTVLARLDGQLFAARVSQCKANVAKAEADVEAAGVKLRLARRELERGQRLSKTGKIPAQELDSLAADADAARANLSVSQSNLALAKANLEEATVNLGYTVIKSPVKGVIVDRRVNLGQTVTASLNAPSLFLIARDLSRMQIWASVNETDVGQIRPGQKVRFTVAAFPKDTFQGRVETIRLNASMSQSVVTYTVVVEVENVGGKLLPYLTARVRFEVEERRDVRTVANAALRWTPSAEHVAPAHRAEFARAQRQKKLGAGDKAPAAAGGEKGYERPGTLWVKDDEFVRPVAVRVGLSDGVSSEVTGGPIREGAEVVVGVALAEGDDGGGSPFLPKIKNDKAKK